MRIAVTCSDLGVRVPGTKGSSIHLTAIARAFQDLGHDVLLLGVAGHEPPPADLVTLLLPHPGRSTGLEHERRKITAARLLVEISRDRLRQFAPDLVYERLSLFGAAGLQMAGEQGAGHVLEVNALLTREQVEWRTLHLVGLAKSCELRVLRSTDLRVVVSEQLGRAVEHAAPGPPTAVVPNGVDVTAFRQLPQRSVARRRLCLPSQARLVGFAGTLRPWHGLDTAVAALTHCRRPLELVVIGDGPVRAQLAEQAARLGVGHRVHWIGQLPHELVPTALAALDVAVAPYPAMDPFPFSPLKLYEYLAAGVPVVASDVGPIASVLQDGRLGRLVAPGDPADLARALDNVFDELPVARQRAELGRAHALSEHSWTQCASTIVSRWSEAAHALAR